MVDDIANAVGQRTANAVFFAFDHFKSFETGLAGRRIARVAARGKAVLVFFAAADDDGPWCVYSHNQLYGQWRIGPPRPEPSTGRQLRFAIYGDARAARLYSASDIRVVRPDALADIPYLARLGPDPLNDAQVDTTVIRAQFDDRRFAGRALGALLLDQSFVAGVGNYLRSEILFEARVPAASRPRDLDDDARQRLAEAIPKLMARAYRLKGVTNDPERAAALKEQGLRYAARRHMVFGRAALPCYDCGTAIEKRVVASRRLYLCPRCQKD
ncbi:endonuclease VIII [Salinisphaera aquimarina]